LGAAPGIMIIGIISLARWKRARKVIVGVSWHVPAYHWHRLQ